MPKPYVRVFTFCLRLSNARRRKTKTKNDKMSGQWPSLLKYDLYTYIYIAFSTSHTHTYTY